MKQNHPTPGWTGKGISAIRGAPEKYDDTTWPTRDGPETRIRDGTHSGPANFLPGFAIQTGDLPIYNRTELRIRDGTNKNVFCSQTLTGLKDAVRFTKKVAALDLTASAGWRTDNVNCTGFKSFGTLLHNPVCRKGRRDDTELRIRDGTIVTRIRDGTPVRIRDDTEINIRDGTFLREKIPKQPALKRHGQGKLCTKNNRKTGLNGGGMEEVAVISRS